MASDPYKYFRVEAREILDDLGKGVLSLEKGPPTPDLVQRLLRLAHTLKGAARVVKQVEIADLAHKLEDVMGPLREGATVMTREGVDASLAILDLMTAKLATLGPAAAAPNTARAQQPATTEPTLRTFRAELAELDPLLNGLAEVNIQLASVRRSSAALEQARRLTDMLSDQLGSPRANALSNAGATAKIRGMTGDLRDILIKFERDLLLGVEQTERELGQVREAAERLRLVPAEVIFSSLERTARDGAVSLGKRVRFESKGGDVRLDADMLTAMQQALVQAVRNAVAHGIETPGERSASGKAPEGRIAIEVARRGSRVSFVCRDDGRGIDLAGVRRAVERGAVNRGGTKLETEDLIRLLLKGGITTSGTVTEIAGRGVGLDVVRDTAARFGGETTLETEAHRGTKLEIVVPASLSALDALIVLAGGEAAAIPLDTVRQTVRVDESDVTRTAEGESIVVEGKVIPFVSLARSLRRAEGQASQRAWSAVVVESNGRRAAVGVDRLIGTENIVLRPLPALTPSDPTLAGASLDPEGNPQLVLDSEGLVAVASKVQIPWAGAAENGLPILVIDDSLTTRMLEQSILESAGYEVDVATSGEEGMESARRKRYALFLVDVEMPGMDGFTFVERTRADPTLRETPAILVTSRASPEDRARGQEVGASAYIVKSEFDQNDLLARIRRLAG